MKECVVHLTYEEQVAVLEFNRPQSFNALNKEMLEQMLQALNDVRKSSADFLILKGRGKAFSAGGDIKMMTALDGGELFSHIMDMIEQVIFTLYTLPQVTIASVHGSAAGLGLSMALACDYAIAEQQAKIAMNFIGIGLMPDGGAHYFLKERLGMQQAKQLIWNGAVLSGDEAKEMGIIDESAIKADEAVYRKVDEWKRKPVLAMRETKQLYIQQTATELQSVLDAERKGQEKMRKTTDHREGIQAFLEKRRPLFTGR